MTDKRKPIRDPENRTASISMPIYVHDAIKERADKEGRNFSNMVTQILREHIEKKSSGNTGST
jgi:hypothetical protein